MTDTWKPSEGLQRAEAVAAQIKDELAAAGIQIAPMYQWRMTQVIGGAIDDAMGTLAPTWGKLDVTAKDVRAVYTAPLVHSAATLGVTGTNAGIWRSNADGQFEQVANGLTEMASEISDDMQETPPASAIHAAEEAPKKRGRGRPPGKKKDKKAGKSKKTDVAETAMVAE